MKNFIYAAADDAYTTNSGTTFTRLTLTLPGHPANPHTWLIIVTWNLSANGALGEPQLEIESAGLNNSGVIADHQQLFVDVDEIESGGAFHLARDVSGDVTISIKVRSVNAVNVTLENARILAIRIPSENFSGLLDHFVLGDVALVGNGTREVHSATRGRVYEGRYLALAMGNMSLPAGTGRVTSCMKLTQGVYTAGSSSVESLEQVPEDFVAESVPSQVPVRLTRSRDASDDRFHPFFHMSVTDLQDGYANCALELQTDDLSSPSSCMLRSASTLLLRLDGLYEFYDARVPGLLQTEGTTLTPHVTNAVDRRSTGEDRNLVHLGYGVMGSESGTSNYGAQMVVRDMESPAVTLCEAVVESLSYTVDTREIVMAGVVENPGPLELACAERGVSSPDNAVFSSLMLLTFVDEQSQRDDVGVTVSLPLDWDLSGPSGNSPVDLETLEKLKVVATMGAPALTLSTIEVAHESLDRARLSVGVRLFSKHGGADWGSLG